MKWKKYCWCRIPRSTGDEVCTVHCAELISPDRPGASSHANDGGVGKFLLTHEHGSLVKEMPREIWRRAKMRTKRICRFGKRRIYYYFHFLRKKSGNLFAYVLTVREQRRLRRQHGKCIYFVVMCQTDSDTSPHIADRTPVNGIQTRPRHGQRKKEKTGNDIHEDNGKMGAARMQIATQIRPLSAARCSQQSLKESTRPATCSVLSCRIEFRTMDKVCNYTIRLIFVFLLSYPPLIALTSLRRSRTVV